MRRKTNTLTLVLVALFCCALVPAVSAFTATSTSPLDGAPIYSGTTITIHLDGLAGGENFAYRITSSNLDTSGNTVTLSNVNMPFSLANGLASTSLTTTGISGPATLTVKRLSDSTEVVLNGNPITSSYNIKKDNYDVSITGTKSSGNIGIDYSVSGTIVNPVDSAGSVDLSFIVTGVNTGTITITVTDGGVTRLEKSYGITIPPAPPSPNGGTDTEPGPEGAPAEAPAAPAAPQQQGPAQLAPMQGTTTTTATISQNQEGQVLADYTIETDPSAGFESQVDLQAGTTAVMGPGTAKAGQPVGEITVTPLDPATVTIDTATTGSFSFSGLAIECGPTGAQFSGSPVTVSFTMTADQWAEALAAVNGNIAAMTIQTFDPATKSWVEVATVVDPVTRTVSADVTHFSTYAVFYKSEKAASVKTIGELAQVTPFQTRVTTAAPAVTPAPTQMAPVATPTQQGGIFDGVFNWFNSLFGKK